MVMGRVAAEEAVPQAVIQAWEDLYQYGYGFRLTIAKKMIGRTMNRWNLYETVCQPGLNP